LIDSGKQDVQGGCFVGQNNGVQLMRQGEYQVEVTAGQQFRFAVIEPFFLCQGLAFRAMAVTAGVVGNLLKCTLVASLNMAPQSGGSAYLDMVHDL
jgi:hypothetical protein